MNNEKIYNNNALINFEQFKYCLKKQKKNLREQIEGDYGIITSILSVKTIFVNIKKIKPKKKTIIANKYKNLKLQDKIQYYSLLYLEDTKTILKYNPTLDLKDKKTYLENYIKEFTELLSFLETINKNAQFEGDDLRKQNIEKYIYTIKEKLNTLKDTLKRIELSIQKAIIPQLIKSKNKTEINKYYTQLIKEKKIQIDLSKFLEHFDFTGTNINQDIKLTPISWKGEIKELIALIKKWIENKVIEDTNYLDIITQHFVDKKGNTYKKTGLKTAKYKLNKKGYQI